MQTTPKRLRGSGREGAIQGGGASFHKWTGTGAAPQNSDSAAGCPLDSKAVALLSETSKGPQTLQAAGNPAESGR
jgi:hypothetical protein